MATIKEAVTRIRNAGLDATRIIPSKNNKYKIQINKSGGWITVLDDLNRGIAEDILQQARNRVICG